MTAPSDQLSLLLGDIPTPVEAREGPTKVCSSCDTEKPLDHFHRKPGNMHGKSQTCKPCTALQAKGQTARRRSLGTVPADYECPICERRKPDGARRWWCADHDHETGAVREYLCHPCNLSLGGLKDSPRVMGRALGYLHRHGKALTTEQLSVLVELHHPAHKET